MSLTPSKEDYTQVLSSFASLAGKAMNVSDQIGYIVADSASLELKQAILPLLNELNRTIERTTKDVQAALPEGWDD